MEIIAATQSQKSASTSDNAAASLADDFDTFLQLLTTQLQYQDPLDPLDSNEFTDQLVSFTGVEQSIETNKNLEQILGEMQQNDMSGALNYLGRAVTIDSATTGLKNGAAEWEYSLAGNANTTSITIRDGKNKIVHEDYGQTAAGLHQYSWTPPEGVAGPFTMDISAETSAEVAIQTTISSNGVIDSIETLEGNTYLSTNGLLVDPSRIIAVRDITPSAAENGS
ncbi:MAG: hypothetical protein CMF31_01065 [Kordiimonas sp.]|nr:hypothetical protein [Kordiimonas sp.]|tara:strand:- start:3347 stop:4018 length:672 start_codon:yes stop_codon:yes gene_type:complete